MSEMPGVTSHTIREIDSMAMPIVDFVPLQTLPSELGAGAHARLEELFGRPIASHDAAPDVSDEAVGQRAGFQLGALAGRERWFVENLPQINGQLSNAAEAHGVTVNQVEDTLTDIIRGSGIGRPMHRTLDRPFSDRRDALDYVRHNSGDGVVLLHRGAIANWAAKRQEVMLELLTGMPESVLQSVRAVIYAGSNQRHYYGPTELWRPETRPFVTGTDEKKNETSSLTEAGAAKEFYVGTTEHILGQLGVDGAIVDLIPVESKSGDDVMQNVIERHGALLRDSLVIEVGNAPAGYIQMNGTVPCVLPMKFQDLIQRSSL
jgi:hypothetical protein